jgi:hypothetical protein
MIQIKPTACPSASSTDVVAITDYLLCCLVDHAPASLRVDGAGEDSNITWYLDSESGSAAVHKMKRFIFRSVLARIGFHYMNSQLYGGESLVRLKKENYEFSASFRLRNSTIHGFGAEIFIERLTT